MKNKEENQVPVQGVCARPEIGRLPWLKKDAP